jgi:hypothetical protein
VSSNNLHRHNVRSFILPYVKQQQPFDQIGFNFNLDSRPGAPGRTTNNKVVMADIPGFVCPSAPARVNAYASDCAVCVTVDQNADCQQEAAGLATTKRDVSLLNGLLGDTPTPIRKVTDGKSKTFMLFEDSARPLLFVKGVQKSEGRPEALLLACTPTLAPVLAPNG